MTTTVHGLDYKSAVCLCVDVVLMETVRESGKFSLSADQLMELTSSLNFLSSSSAQALPVKAEAVSRSSTPLGADEQQELSELQPLSLPSSDVPGTSFNIGARTHAHMHHLSGEPGMASCTVDYRF